jgi:PAS domain S-box-containing protein
VRAVAAFPLEANGHALGVLGIFHTDPAKSFDEERVWLLGHYAQLAAIALDHALLVSGLRESEERFRVAFEHAPVARGVSLPDGRWVRVNRVFCDLLGYSEQELLALRSDDVTHPDDLARTLEARASLAEGRVKAFDIEKRYVRKDGSTVWARATVACVRDEQGRPRYLIGDVQDLSGCRRMEEAVREQAVTRSLVRAMLQDIGRAGHLPSQLMRDLGRRLAGGVQGTRMQDWLAAYSAMGLGTLEITSAHGGRFTLHGRDLLELTPGATQPSCRLPLGFIEGAYRATTGH